MKFQELQKKVSSLVVKQTSSPSEYWNLFEEVDDISEIPDYIRRPKLAFLSNFTINRLPELIQIRSTFHNLLPEFYLGPYDQVGQEILKSDSTLYSFSPDLIYLIIDSKTFPVSQITELVNQLLLRTKAGIVVFDKEIADSFKNNKQIILFDFEKWLDESSHRKNWYTKYKDLGDLRLAPVAFPDLAEALLSYTVAISGATKKCVVVDLDNTLWQGILGEDGLENIKPRKELQKFLLDLTKKGIILAINSRNNEDEALNAIEKHPGMILRKKDFADWQINWGDKAQNMAALAESLNLGIDSFVFLDDDEFQLNLIREAFPQVATISAKDEQSALDFLKNYAGFAKLEITKEDLKRGQMYAEERQRKTLQTSLKTVDDFIKELDIKVEIKEVNDQTLARAAQLTQKTNQFNLTTRRYSEADIKFFLSEKWKIWTISATDKFGDYGIVGLIIIDTTTSDNYWRVNNFLMSCRILGRGIENKSVDFISDEAKKNKINAIFAYFIPTSKNVQVKDFWNKSGFKFTGHGGKGVNVFANIDYMEFVKFL